MDTDKPLEFEERPTGYVGPNLNPEGLVLDPKELDDGVYALMANEIPKDNNGVIMGDDAVLVVDAGINGDVSRQIQDRVEELTDAPIRYLVNTTFHGDHTFGNDAFPDDATIVSSVKNKEMMRSLEQEKRMRTRNLRGNGDALADVTHWRRPDVTFDHYAEIDLGNEIVELRHFGPGNGPGDVVVYMPDAKVAWTGNFVMSSRVTPMLLGPGPESYIETLEKVRETLDIETIVPGHGPTDEGTAAVDSLIEYLEDIQTAVRASLDTDHTVEETLQAVPLPAGYRNPENGALTEALQHMHELNVLATYRALDGEA